MWDIVLDCVQLLLRKPGETAKLLPAIPFVNGHSILLCLPQSFAHTPSISFILGSRCMYLNPFLRIWAFLSQHQTCTCICITRTVSFSLEQCCSLVEEASRLDKGGDLISAQRHNSHTELQCNYSSHPCWPSGADLCIPNGAVVSVWVLMRLLFCFFVFSCVLLGCISWYLNWSNL